MPTATTRLLLLVLQCSILITCQRSESEKPPIPPVARECAETRRVRLGIAGGYGINGFSLFGVEDTLPFVYLDPVFEAGSPRTVPPLKLFRLAQYPAVSVESSELCTAETDSGGPAVRCLGEDGKAVSVALRLDELASRLGVNARCLELENGIGSRALDRLTERWQTTLAACSKESKSKSAEVMLELRAPPASAGCGGPTHPRCAQVQLSIPPIGFKKNLGVIWDFPQCSVTHLPAPVGIEIACSGNSLSYAQVYHYGRAVFYRIEEASDQRREGRGPAMQEVSLPSGTRPVFRFRSFAPLNGESPN